MASGSQFDQAIMSERRRVAESDEPLFTDADRSICQIGNSKASTLPPRALEILGLDVGDGIEISVHRNKIVIRGVGDGGDDSGDS